MAYTALDATKPAASQTGTQAIDSSRYNIMALRDALIANGVVQGFNYSWSGGTADQPTYMIWSRSTERVRLTLTWSSSKVTKIAYEYSSNSGSSYDPMADASGYYVETYTYDGSGYLTSTSWGATP